MTTKGYDLYPCGGSFSVRTADYHDTAYTVAAPSVRQAYALAHKTVWINPAVEHPVGIVSIYRRGPGVTLWCGCSGHHVQGGQPSHGAGVRALGAPRRVPHRRREHCGDMPDKVIAWKRTTVDENPHPDCPVIMINDEIGPT